MRLRKRDGDSDGDMTIHGWYGREVKDPFPEGVLAFQQPHEYADADRLERARQIFPQASMDDYEVRQVGVDSFLFVDKATGVEYRRDHSDPLLQPNPRGSDVVCFVVDAGNRIHYLRPNAPQAPEQVTVLVASVTAREVT